MITTHVGRVDPDVLKSNFHSAGTRNALRSDDETLDTLLEEISSLASTEERYAKAAEVQNYLIDNAYTIPLYELPQTYARRAVRARVRLRGGRPGAPLQRVAGPVGIGRQRE